MTPTDLTKSSEALSKSKKSCADPSLFNTTTRPLPSIVVPPPLNSCPSPLCLPQREITCSVNSVTSDSEDVLIWGPGDKTLFISNFSSGVDLKLSNKVSTEKVIWDRNHSNYVC